MPRRIDHVDGVVVAVGVEVLRPGGGSGTGVAVLRQEAGDGGIVVAGMHVQQAGRIRYTACERHLVEERIARAGRHAELVIVVGFDHRARAVHDRRHAFSHVVPVVEAPVCDIQQAPSLYGYTGGNLPVGLPAHDDRKALPEFYMKPISLHEPLLFYNL